LFRLTASGVQDRGRSFFFVSVPYLFHQKALNCGGFEERNRWYRCYITSKNRKKIKRKRVYREPAFYLYHLFQSLDTKQLYVLYDDAGKLTLKNINTMKLNLLIDEETGENFSYESSIDEQTYNKIKLAYNNEKTGKRELFIAQDGAKMNQWGVLQYFEEVQTQTGASAKADALLKLYDQKTRKLTIQNAFGDVRVRAGSAVVVALNLGDIVTNNYMVVNKVTHTFRGDEHMMELDLIGGEFIA